jgi:NitT/TauT family transport system substrate-binding protein
MPDRTSLTLALDWTPNTNHTGFYVAQAKGWYQDAGLDVRLVHAGQDDYARTPARKVAEGAADLALAPSESVVSYRTADTPTPLRAIAAILAQDASAIVTLNVSGLDRPAKLDGHLYASYQARFEDAIVRAVVRADGGRGDVAIDYPPKLGIWNTLLNGEASATWIFDPWEGVEADRKGVEMNRFVVGDYGVPYGYSPVLVAHDDTIRQRADDLRAFLEASRRGYELALADPDTAADLLIQQADHDTLADAEFVRASQRAVVPFYTHDGLAWGTMQDDVWTDFVGWLAANELITSRAGDVIAAPDMDTLFTNDLLAPAA